MGIRDWILSKPAPTKPEALAIECLEFYRFVVGTTEPVTSEFAVKVFGRWHLAMRVIADPAGESDFPGFPKWLAAEPAPGRRKSVQTEPHPPITDIETLSLAIRDIKNWCAARQLSISEYNDTALKDDVRQILRDNPALKIQAILDQLRKKRGVGVRKARVVAALDDLRATGECTTPKRKLREPTQ